MSTNIIIYTTDDGISKIELRLENGTVWLSQLQIAELFETSKQNINKHIQSIYDDEELDEGPTVNQQLTVQTEGNREVSRTILLYNLDVVLAVGYRVRSVRGAQFRRYASTILKEYLEKGFALNDERLKSLGGGSYWKELSQDDCRTGKASQSQKTRSRRPTMKAAGRKPSGPASPAHPGTSVGRHRTARAVPLPLGVTDVF